MAADTWDTENRGPPGAFVAPYAPPDEELAARLIVGVPRAPEVEARIDARATRLIEGIRAHAGGLGGVEDFLHAYSLSTKEGLALMVLAEALLRVPDAATADRLIEDKLASGDWCRRMRHSSALLVSASAWTLGVTARLIQPGETPENILESLVKRLGLPAVRTATRQAMRAAGLPFRARADHRGGAAAGRPPMPRLRATRSTCSGEGARTRGRRGALFRRLCRRHRRRSARRRRGRRCRTGRASRSSSRRSTRATRRSRARACSTNWCRSCSSSPARRGATTSTSPSMPRKPTGSSCRSTSSRAVLARSVAARLGGLRACRAGLSEARRRR